MKKTTVFLFLIVTIMTLGLVGCGKDVTANADLQETQNENEKGLIVVGFSQVGAESDWRKANTESMKETFTKENGYELIIDDAQQKQSKQITAIRTFIQQEVDYIVLAPVTEDGWDTVLSEAKDAGIPVIIVDRMVSSTCNGRYECWVGSDFKLEGEKVAEWLRQYTEKKGIAPEDVNIVSIQGTIGASSQIGRSEGLREAVRANGWNLLAEGEGEYTQARAREVMAKMLRRYDNINVVYCENDNEAFGAIEAIEDAGKRVGPNIERGQIMVLSFDGVSSQALEFAKNGKIACIGECNPLHGPRVRNIIERIEKGDSPDRYEYVDENIFSCIDGITSVTVKDTTYPVVYIN